MGKTPLMRTVHLPSCWKDYGERSIKREEENGIGGQRLGQRLHCQV